MNTYKKIKWSKIINPIRISINSWVNGRIKFRRNFFQRIYFIRFRNFWYCLQNMKVMKKLEEELTAMPQFSLKIFHIRCFITRSSGKALCLCTNLNERNSPTEGNRASFYSFYITGSWKGLLWNFEERCVFVLLK